MAVLGRLLFGSSERLDLPDLLSLDSFTSADFKFLLQSFVGGTTPYILSGFDVIQPQAAVDSLDTISIQVANSVVYHPSSTAGSFFFGLEEGNALAAPLVPDLRKDARNFVYLTFDTTDQATDKRAFWDPDQDGGAGGEFSQDVNTESVLIVKVNVSTSTFPDGTIPVCIVDVGPASIDSIQDARHMMFRLGTGGVSPDPFATFSFRDLPTGFSRTEPPTIMNTSTDPNPFQGGDKNIFTLKEWMDVVMTKLKELSGTTYWYEGTGTGSAPSITNVFLDALGSTIKSKGEWQHDGVTAGDVTWTEDIHYLSLTDPRDIIFRASTKSIANDDEVAFVNLIRDANINNTGTPVTFVGTGPSALKIVNGPVGGGAFANLKQGDWIKKKSDSTLRYLRVEQFYAGQNLGGGVTVPATAESIELSDDYSGLAGTEIAEYTKGEYLTSDIQVAPRNDPAVTSIQDAGGNFFWLAGRSDTILGISNITTTTITPTISDFDGKRAKADATGHGLIDGDRVIFSGYTGARAVLNGTSFKVEVEDANTFFIETGIAAGTASEAGSAFYAIITTAARATTVPAPTFALETAEHNFESDQRIVVAGTSGLYDASFLINPRSSTTIQIPVGSAIGPAATGTCTLPRVNVRTEFGAVKVVQGESVDIGDADTSNILSYLGMESLAQSLPDYHIPSNYPTLNGFANYNAGETSSGALDDITTRVAKLTAMMAGRVQDRGIVFTDRTNILNTTNGANQDITATNTIMVEKPGGDQQEITLTASIPVNSAAVAVIDRDGASGISLVIESLGSPYLIAENKLIMFYRFNTTTVYDWRGNTIEPNEHINTGQPEDSQNRNVTVYNTGRAQLNQTSGLVTFSGYGSCPEITRLDFTGLTGATFAVGAVPGLHFLIDSASGTNYYVWYDTGPETDPAVGGRTGITVSVAGGDSAATLASKTQIAIDAVGDFGAIDTGNQVDITDATTGPVADAVDVDSTISITTIAQGQDTLQDIELVINGSSNLNTIDVSAINTLGTLIVADGKAVWCRINRDAAKTFNTVATVDSPESGATGNLYVTDIADVPLDQDVFVLYSRRGNLLLEYHKAALPDDDNVYDEELLVLASGAANTNEINGPVTAGTSIPLPNDSRDGGGAQTYIVGAGHLEIDLNGQRLLLTDDYTEEGTTGCEGTRIKLLQDLVVGDKLGFRIDSKGSVFFASATLTSDTLQAAHDAGRFITVVDGQPVTIIHPTFDVTRTTGSPPYKALEIQGDLTVLGIIDPGGMEITTDPNFTGPDGPLEATSHGIWVDDASKDLIYKTNSAMGSMRISSLKVGTFATNTELTKTILDNLIPLQSGTDFADGTNSHIHDARYYTETELSSDTNGSDGSRLIGDNAASYINISPPTSLPEISTVDTSGVTGTNLDISANGNAGAYWTIYPQDGSPTGYYVWYKVTNGNNQLDPQLAGDDTAALSGFTGIQVDVVTGDADTDVATKTATAVNTGLAADFVTPITAAGTVINMTQSNDGPVTDVQDIVSGGTAQYNTGFAFSTPQQGLLTTGSVRSTLETIDTALGTVGADATKTYTNDSGVTIAIDNVVIQTQGVNDRSMTVADATTEAGGEGVLGISKTQVTAGLSGQVTISGEATLAPGGFTRGQPVYLSATNPGEGTHTAPSSVGNIVVHLGTAVSPTEIKINIYTVGVIEA